MSKIVEDTGNGQDRPAAQHRGPDRPPSGEDENATQKAASAIAEALLHRRLTEQEKQMAGPAVHYLFGSSMGAAYGVLAELTPVSAAGWGLPFATALWVGADELAVPLLGLSRAPTEYPASKHASAFASHLVYGLTTDVVRRIVRVAL